MNSPFMQERAADLVKVRRVRSRRADRRFAICTAPRSIATHAQELDLALSYLNNGNAHEYAQALLATNEVIFWP